MTYAPGGLLPERPDRECPPLVDRGCIIHPGDIDPGERARLLAVLNRRHPEGTS